MSDKKPGEVTAAASALEAALEAFERTTAAATRMSLSSQRNVEKAANAVTDAVGHQPAIAEGVQRLMAALNAARDRNAAGVEALSAFAERVKDKSETCAALLGRFGALGEQARGTTDAVRELAGAEVAALSTAEKVERLADVERRMAALVDDAGTLTKDARAAEFEDIAKQVEALRQQVQAARNKVTLFTKKIEGA